MGRWKKTGIIRGETAMDWPVITSAWNPGTILIDEANRLKDRVSRDPRARGRLTLKLVVEAERWEKVDE